MRVRPAPFLVAFLLLLPALAAPAAPEAPVLARVDAASAAGLAVHARFRGEGGRDVALVVGPAEGLAPLRATVLDADARGVPYALVSTRPGGAAPRELPAGKLLAVEGGHAVVRLGEGDEEALRGADLVVKRLPAAPLSVEEARPGAIPAPASDDPAVWALIAPVTEAAVFDLNGRLSGESAVTVGGSPYTILTRHTRSGTPITNATQYAADRFAAAGLTTSFFPWTFSTTSGRNVVGEKTGATLPTEVVLVTAHLDDMPSSGRAPGADDNASGATAVILAAERMATQPFERTVRFVLFTGEEQGLYGSDRYAASLATAGTNVVAVLNLDMIGWESAGAPVVRLHTRTTTDPGYAADLAVATLFSSAVRWYGMEFQLSPLVEADAIPYSDHASFWDRGFPGILAIEDDVDDFNPYYHTSSDLRASLDLPYFTAFTKATIATAAHLAGPLPAPGYFTTAPCRLVDTRLADGALGGPALAPSSARTFSAASGACGVPGTAKALALNVTAVTPAAAGHVVLHPGGGPLPSTSTLNFAPGVTRANNAIVPVSTDGTASIAAANSSAAPLHLLLDVAGWFQ